jgi:ATP-dependent Clp protease protease subunit
MKIHLLETITDELAREVISKIADNQDDIIEVIIMSPGGSVVAGNAIIAALQGSGVTIHTRVIGMAASMAAVISQIGDVREIDSDALFKLHFAAVGTTGRGTKEDHIKAAELLDGVNDMLLKKLKNTKLRKRDLVKLMSEDRALLAEEAYNFGFFDHLTEPLKAVALITNNSNMETVKQKGIISQAKSLLGFSEPASEEEKELVEAMTEAVEKQSEEEAAERVVEAKGKEGAEILTAEMVTSKEFLELKNTYTPLFKSLLNLLEELPSTEEIEKLIEAKAEEKVNDVLRKVRSKTVAPRNAANGFQVAAEEIKDDKTPWVERLNEIKKKNKI